MFDRRVLESFGSEAERSRTRNSWDQGAECFVQKLLVPFDVLYLHRRQSGSWHKRK